MIDWGADNTTLIFRRLKMPEVLEAVERTNLLRPGWCDGIGFDLSAIDTAFSAQALPLAVVAQGLRMRGVPVRLTLPTSPQLRQLFLNTNWAHLIDPDRFPPSDFDGHHIPATPYDSAAEQQDLVNRTMDLLLEEGHIDRPVLGALEWCLSEVTDNVLTHAGGVGGILQVTRYEDCAHVVVCDTGRGIGTSMREAFPALDDLAAAKHSLLPGVTSGPGQGNGLAGIDSIARLSRGEVNLISGAAFGMMSYSGKGRDTWEPVAGGVSFPGTAVRLTLPLDVHLDLRHALSFQSPDWEPWDFIDARYEADDGAYHLVVAEERRGVASREAGRALRTKAENLLGFDAAGVISIDFSDVRMIASSFADEFIGKLRASVGAAEFDRRVRIVGIEPPLDAVLAGAASQRMRSS